MMKSTISLINRYSKTAKQIENSARAMGKAVEGVGDRAKKSSGLLNALSKKRHDIKIKDVGSKEAQKAIRNLQNEYQKATGKRYKISVSTETGRIENLKNSIKGIGSGLNQFKLDSTGFIKAYRDAKKVRDETMKLTGKKHRLHIEIPDTWKAGLEKLKGGLGAVKSGAGKLLGLGAKGALAGGAVVAGGAATLGGVAMKKGYDRLSGIDTAQAKLRGLGHDQGSVDVIMSNAMASVKGTSFGMAEAATTGAGAVAAGMKPGEELERMLKSVANSAAAAETGMDEMGSIFNKVLTSNAAHNDVLGQVADRGIPIYQALADVMGVSADQIKDMASDGKISYEQFEQAMTKASGTVATEMGTTMKGRIANFGAALGRLGAGVLGGIFPKLKEGVGGLTEIIDKLSGPAQAFGEKIGGALSGLMDNMPNMFSGIKDFVSGLDLSAFKPALMDLGSALMELTGSMFPPLLEAGKAVATALVTLLPPVISTLANIIRAVVIPVFNQIGAVITGVVIPVFNAVVAIIKSFVIPAFNLVVNIIKAVFKPALEAVSNLLKGPVKKGFDILNSAVKKVCDIFDQVRGAVSNFIGSIRNGISGLFGRSREGNATGTTHWKGGWTRINERGDEMVRLPRGTTIYPSGKTDKIMKHEFEKSSSATGNKHVEININVQGGQTEKDTARVIRKEILRILPNI